MSTQGRRAAARAWMVSNRDPGRIGQFNSVCTVCNGYMALKGTLCEDRRGPGPMTLIHGLYDELDVFRLLRPSAQPRPWLDPAHFDDATPMPAVCNLPDPLAVRVFVGGREIALDRGEVLAFWQRLSLADGLYEYELTFRDAAGRATRLQMMRFVSLVHPHRAYMRYVVAPLDHTAPVRILSGICGATCAHLTGERRYTIVALDADSPRTCRMHARTRASGIDVHLRVRTEPHRHTAVADLRGLVEHDAVWTVIDCPGGQRAVIERTIVLASSDDDRHGGGVDADHELEAATSVGFYRALEASARAWKTLWQQTDVQIEGDELADRDLRFCVHHLLAAGPRFSDRLSVPVKLLTGDAYQGNTFYDTDLYIVPFYVWTQPALARAHLRWRIAGLGPGRQIARALGCQGAKLAWQAGPDGQECLGPWYRFTRTNIHVNADACYALHRYVQTTGDHALLAEGGIDLLVESARFYTARSHRDANGTYHLHHVAGPDEAHCDSSDNFYTNWLARWTLRHVGEALEHLRCHFPQAHDAACERLRLADEEPAQWRQVAARLALLRDDRTGLYEQCRGFWELPEAPPDVLENRRDWFVPLWRWRALNQPDVLMAMMLFLEEFDEPTLRAHWQAYNPLSMNFSSMSFPCNAIIAARIGQMDEAVRNFRVACGMDIDESLTGRGDTHAGLHGTAMGGAWLAVAAGFAGLHFDGRKLHVRPRLPAQWQRLRLPIVVRGARIVVEITQRQACVHRAQGLAGDDPDAPTPEIVVQRPGG